MGKRERMFDEIHFFASESVRELHFNQWEKWSSVAAVFFWVARIRSSSDNFHCRLNPEFDVARQERARAFTDYLITQLNHFQLARLALIVNDSRFTRLLPFFSFWFVGLRFTYIPLSHLFFYELINANEIEFLHDELEEEGGGEWKGGDEFELCKHT